MNFDEKMMLDYLKKGKNNALKSPSLQILFKEIGHDYNDPQIRSIIRRLIIDHHIPIIGGTTGFYISENSEEAINYTINLIARIDGIQERLEHFRIAAFKTPFHKQISLF